MMKQNLNVFSALFLFACVFSNVLSQCPTFYADYNQQGGSFQQCSSGNVAANWNDQVSSLVVPAGYSVLLYADYGYGGQTAGPYTQGSYNVPDWFNDQLSSIKITQVSNDDSDNGDNRNNRPNRHNGYGSDNNNNGYNRPNRRNGYSSDNDNNNGYSRPNRRNGYGSDNNNNNGYNRPNRYNSDNSDNRYNRPNWNNNQNSDSRYNRPNWNTGPNRYNSDNSDNNSGSNCVTFYTDYNEQGSSFQMCRSGDVPSNWNDQVSSFCVPPGTTVCLYQDYGQGGKMVGPYRQGEYNVPGWFNDQLSSIVLNC